MNIRLLRDYRQIKGSRNPIGIETHPLPLPHIPDGSFKIQTRGELCHRLGNRT